jgi:hypothetical protein
VEGYSAGFPRLIAKDSFVHLTARSGDVTVAVTLYGPVDAARTLHEQRIAQRRADQLNCRWVARAPAPKRWSRSDDDDSDL